MIAEQRLQELFTTVPPELMAAVATSFAAEEPTEHRVRAVRDVLSAAGKEWRSNIGEWIADLLSVEQLVPDVYSDWRPLVHHAMAFVASHISDERLAPKIVEQVELPPETAVEKRLGLIIAKTPGLQKLGQVLARTRRLSPPLRAELQKLENGIKDVTAGEIQAVVQRQLGRALDAYKVFLASDLLSEASVSAILEFTWFNPRTGKREEGVFKVMKPHVPASYAEDLQLLKDLAEDLGSRGREYYFASREVADTLEEVRLLLEREVDFRREQATLAEVARVYPRAGTHAPSPIPELSTDTITAMTLERGVKVTEAMPHNVAGRRRLASRIVEALIADPIFSTEENAIFHADPHAGNLLYNEQTDQLIVLDWALTGRLSREARRQVARLMSMVGFRDKSGVREAIGALSKSANGSRTKDLEIIDRCVNEFFDNLPFASSPGALDAMHLLDHIGVEGVRFPASLVFIRKVMFTLDGVLNDIAGGGVQMDAVVAREFVARMIRQRSLPAPFDCSDYLAIQRSALLYVSGLWYVQA